MVTLVFVLQPYIIFKLCLLCKFLLEVFASRNASVFYRAAVFLVISCLTHDTCLFIKETITCHYDTKVNHKVCLHKEIVLCFYRFSY